MNREQIQELVSADEDELYSILGVAALSVEQSPLSLLQEGRAGQFYSSGPAILGPEVPFDHAGLKKAAHKFLERWGAEIKKAVCGNQQLYAAEKKQAAKQLDVWVATLVTTLSVSIHALAPFTVVVNVLAIMIVRSGLTAFCQEVLPKVSKSP
jgi:hypothetical protein